jgi:CYTH domain-containing protein
MAIEIERKFLIADESWKHSVVGSVYIRDGLIANYNDRKVRVRIYDKSATITLKGHHAGITRAEFEYPIPLSDAEEIIRTMCDDHVLEKRRYFVPYEGINWEIDAYEGILNGIVLAEIELKTMDQTLTIPQWIGREVTGDPKYRKINMFAERMSTIKSTRLAS